MEKYDSAHEVSAAAAEAGSCARLPEVQTFWSPVCARWPPPTETAQTSKRPKQKAIKSSFYIHYIPETSPHNSVKF